jgi:lysophospholipase L1-like esterase
MKTPARLWPWVEMIAGCVWLPAALVLSGWRGPSGVWLVATLGAGVVLAGSWALRLAWSLRWRFGLVGVPASAGLPAADRLKPGRERTPRSPRWRVGLVWSAAVPLLLVAGVPAALLADVDSLTRVRVVETLGLDGMASNSAVRPVPHALEEHERLLRITQGGAAGVVFLGDSLTSRWATAGKAIWDRLFAPLDAVNFGVGEDRVENVLWRVQNGELDGLRPRAVVLLIGTNNLGHNTPGQLTEGMALLLREIRQRQPRAAVLLLGLLPRASAASSPMRDRIREVNRRLADLAVGERIHFRDVGAVLLEKDRTLSAETAPDELHLSAEGYRRLGEAIRPALAALLAEPAGARTGERAAGRAALSWWSSPAPHPSRGRHSGHCHDRLQAAQTTASAAHRGQRRRSAGRSPQQAQSTSGSRRATTTSLA